MPAITTTMSQILKGLKALRGPISASGSTGSSTREMSRKRRGGVKLHFAQEQHPLLDLALEPHQEGRQHGAGHRPSLGLCSTDISPSR